MVHGLRLAELESKVEQLERDKRRNIIVVDGVPEDAQKPSPKVIEELFADLNINFDTLVCDRIYRRGKAPPEPSGVAKAEVAKGNYNTRATEKRPRPIVVGFKQFEDKIQVFKHIKNLQGLERWTKVYISDDLTETQQRQLRDLKALSSYARNKGHNSNVKANCIIVDGRKFPYRDLHKLPPELTLEKAKTIECLDGNGVAFQSVHSPLSNLYPCNIVYKGNVFLSAEGALQHAQATVCGRLAEACAIQFERDAYEVKRIAGTLGHSPEWDVVVVDVLLEILIVKFKTNKHCRAILLATG